jgi:hypothetical protein
MHVTIVRHGEILQCKMQILRSNTKCCGVGMFCESLEDAWRRSYCGAWHSTQT